MDQQQAEALIQKHNLLYTLQVEDSLESTNTSLLQQAKQGQAPNHCLVAKNQTQGRGRQGKLWISTPNDSLTFSLLVEFNPEQTPATTLPLKAALALARAITDGGNENKIQLKWPNDVLNHGRKVAGILVELADHPAQTPHAHYAVVGVGLNLRLNAETQDEIPTPATDINSHQKEELLAGFLRAFHTLQNPDPNHQWMADWNSLCIHQNRTVRLIAPNGQEQIGISQGISKQGELILNQNGMLVTYHSGELSLRMS